MGILSRLEGIFAPERLGKATPKASFESSSRDSRRRGILPGGRPTDQRRDLTGGNRMEMIKRSRYAHRNSGMSAEQRGMMAIYAIGSGRWPCSLAADMAWRDEAEALFIERVRKPEITGRFNWRETQSLISRALDRDGEIFAIKTRDLFDLPKVQLLETHAFSTTTDAERRIFDGIQYDGVGRPVFYFLIGADGKDIPLPASAVVHVFDADCSSMSRAIPLQQHGLLHIHDQLEMLASEKHAVKRLQQEAMVLKSNRERALDDGDFSLDSERAEIEAGTLTTDELEVAEAFGARVQRINTDETLEGFTFQRPHSGFMEFQTQLERDAAGGGLPWEVVRDPSKVGGASVRLVTSKAERYIAHRGGVIDERFNSEMWLYVIGDAINKRELPAVKGWSKVEWGAPKKLSVDAGRDSQAARLDVEVGLKTWAQEIEERGGDFDEWLAERSEQARRIMTAAGKPESEPIPLWMLYKPAGVSLSAAVEQDSTLSEE